jgi:hypothetical protein
MILRNPFPLEVRLLYLDCWTCWLCGSNGSRSGGLEIHHIMGRNSDSAFNSSCLCKGCHSHMGHSQEEEQQLFLITLEYLKRIEYVPIKKDWDFFQENYQRLNSPELQAWLKKNR